MTTTTQATIEVAFNKLNHDQRRILGLRISQGRGKYLKQSPSGHVIHITGRDRYTIQVYGIKIDMLDPKSKLYHLINASQPSKLVA